jgi:hypothetical protein
VDGGCSGCLEGEPLLQASTTEGMEAVEERERLVEEIGADLKTVSRRIPALHSKSTAKGATLRWTCRAFFLVPFLPSHCLVVPSLRSFPASSATPTSKNEHQLTEHVNSLSRSPCTPLFRSPSAIATRLPQQPGQGRCMPVL